MSITYIHYGSTTFDMDKYVDVKNDDCFLKPIGGFYAVREEFADAYVSFAEDSSVASSISPEAALSRVASNVAKSDLNCCISTGRGYAS